MISFSFNFQIRHFIPFFQSGIAGEFAPYNFIDANS
jgi:hypothetical protein